MKLFLFLSIFIALLLYFTPYLEKIGFSPELTIMSLLSASAVCGLIGLKILVDYL